MSEELKPCPFCNNTKDFSSGITTSYTGSDKVMYITCKTCQASGPQALTFHDARKQWNERIK